MSECPDMDTLFQDTYGQNHGQTSTTQWFRLNEICMVTRLQGHCGKGSSNLFLNWNGRRYRIGNANLFTENKVYAYLSTWMTLECQDSSRTWLHVEEINERRWF